MKVISLRNIPPKIARLIEARSQETGLSLNKTVIQLLEEALGVSGPAGHPREYRDLDDVVGAWTLDEAREFDEILGQQRCIDPEIWE